MKINSLNRNMNNKKLINNIENKMTSKSLDSNNCPNVYPQNYYISFGAVKDFQAVYSEHKDTQMPSTVRDYIENQEFLLSEKDFKAFTQIGLKAIQRFAFDDLKECKTIKDIQRAYPNEQSFKNLKSLEEVQTDSPVFNTINALNEKGIKIFDCEEDITTFIVKKIYLEGKTFKDTLKDVVSITTPEAKEVKKLLDNENKYDHARAFFTPLGIEPPNGRTYGRDLQNSDPNFLNGRKEYFSNLTPEQVNEKIQKLLQNNEKSKFAMMDAWNHCENIRFDLSKHLIDRIGSINGGSFDFYDPSFYIKMRLVMNEFWQKYPQYKQELGKEIKLALEKFDKFKAGDEEAFKAYKEDIKKKSQEIKTKIQNTRESEKPNLSISEKMLQKIVQKANPMTLKTGSSNQDFYRLLKEKVSEKEMKVLEGDSKSKEYQTLFPEGIKDKMRTITKTPQYANIFNSQNLAILRELEVSGELMEEDFNELLFSETPFNVELKELTLKHPELDIDNVNRKYDRYKTPLSREEKDKVKECLIKGNRCFAISDTQKLESLLKSQGQYTKFILDNDNLKNITEVLFWKEFDKQYGTSYEDKILTQINSELNITSAIEIIDDIDFSDLLN